MSAIDEAFAGIGGGVQVVQFVSLVVVQTASLTVFTLLFVLVRASRPDLFAGARPASAVATAPGFVAWARSIARIDEDELYEAGGIDAVLHARVTKLHLTLCSLVTFFSLPVLTVYCATPAATDGFGRVGMTNVLKTPGLSWPLWLTVLTAWANLGATVYLIERFEKAAAAYARERLLEGSSAGLQDYALILTDLPVDVKRADVVAAFEAGAVVGVHMVRGYGPLGKAPMPPTREPRGVRAVTAAFAVSLKALADAQATATRARACASEQPDDAKAAAALRDAEEGVRKAHAEAAELQKALRHALRPYPALIDATGAGDEGGPLTLSAAAASSSTDNCAGGWEVDESSAARAAVVVLDTLERAAGLAAQRALGAAASQAMAGVAVWPAPEPRDIRWAVLEDLPQPARRVAQRVALAAVRAALYLFYSFLLVLLTAAVLAVVALADRLPLPSEVLVVTVILSGVLPDLIKSTVFNLVPAILDAMGMHLGAIWTASGAALDVQSQFAAFLRIVAFLAPLLAAAGASVADAVVLRGVTDPLGLVATVAGGVPSSVSIFMSFAFLRTVAEANAVTGVVPAVVAGARLRFLAKTPFARAQVLRAPEKREAVRSGWLVYSHLVTAAFAPVAPVIAPLCALFALVTAAGARAEAATQARCHYDSRGAHARLAIRQLAGNLVGASVLHLGLLGLTGGEGRSPWYLILLAPLVLVAVVYRVVVGRRHATARATFGSEAEQWQPSLAAAAALDARRPADTVAKLHDDLAGALRAWAAPCAPAVQSAGEALASAAPVGEDLSAQGVISGQQPAGEAAQARLDGWLRRAEGSQVTRYTAQPGGRDVEAAADAGGAGGGDASPAIEADRVSDSALLLHA